MQIIAFYTSSHKNGNNARLAREIIRGAVDSGAEVEDIFLDEGKVKICTGCMACLKTDKCVLEDDFDKIRSRMENCDGMIMVTPAMGFLPSPFITNIINRIGMFQLLCSRYSRNKYFAMASIGSGMQIQKVTNYMAAIPVSGCFGRGYVSGKLNVALKGKKVEDVKGAMEKAYALGKKLVEDISSKKKYPFQAFSTRFMFDRILESKFKKFIKLRKDGSWKAVYDYLAGVNLV